MKPNNKHPEQDMREALRRAEMKLRAYVGVCKDDKELPVVIDLVQAALASQPEQPETLQSDEMVERVATAIREAHPVPMGFEDSRWLSKAALSVIQPVPASASVDEVEIGGMSLAELRQIAKRDDCLERLVPSDLRQILGLIPAMSPRSISLPGEDAIVGLIDAHPQGYFLNGEPRMLGDLMGEASKYEFARALLAHMQGITDKEGV